VAIQERSSASTPKERATAGRATPTPELMKGDRKEVRQAAMTTNPLELFASAAAPEGDEFGFSN